MKKDTKEINLAGYSLQTFLITLLGVLIFGIYIGVLLNGENSLTILNKLIKNEKILIKEKKDLKLENKKLQKDFFVLKQLEPKE